MPASTTSKFDISLEVLLIKNKMQLSFEYCTKLFDEIFISNFAKAYEKILMFVLEHPNTLIADIPIFENKNTDNVFYKFKEIKINDSKKFENNNLFTKKASNNLKYINNVEVQNSNYIEPRNDMEQQIASAFKKLLQVPNISIDDNFFELGGDSLTAINLQVELMKSNVELTYSDIFECPTIRTLAEKISSNEN